jgi:hypothetical protein
MSKNGSSLSEKIVLVPASALTFEHALSAIEREAQHSAV